MPAITWKEEYSVGIKTVDEQKFFLFFTSLREKSAIIVLSLFVFKKWTFPSPTLM